MAHGLPRQGSPSSPSGGEEVPVHGSDVGGGEGVESTFHLGLMVVDKLAVRWGLTIDGKKAVWFEVDRQV